jgi:hypothetical protein
MRDLHAIRTDLTVASGTAFLDEVSLATQEIVALLFGLHDLRLIKDAALPVVGCAREPATE